MVCMSKMVLVQEDLLDGVCTVPDPYLNKCS
jgi:hypothetical protein